MVKMLTVFGDVSKMRYNDLRAERRAQKFLLRVINTALKAERAKNETAHKALAKADEGRNRFSAELSDHKVALLEAYADSLEALIKDIDYQMSRKSEPESNAESYHGNPRKTKRAIREENARKRKMVTQQASLEAHARKSMEYDGLLVSWDKDRFLLVAEDNGYQTESALIYAVAKELNLNRARAEALINRGRFTWGQVLCLGAMLEMTPKEFCDVFLAGYFVDRYGEYVADYENLCKEELLRKAIKPPKDIFEEMERVEVGADGRPLDEEEWVTD